MNSTKQSEFEFRDSIVDDEYLIKKQELASRIANNRANRIRLRQELNEYKIIKLTGKQSLEDPKVQTEVLKLKIDLKSEQDLSIQLKNRLDDLKNRSKNNQEKIKELVIVIQNQKSSDFKVDSEIQLQEINKRKIQIDKDLKIKKAKILNLKHEINKLKTEIKDKETQQQIVDIVKSWQQGNSPPEESDSYIISAYQLYSNASESLKEAKFAYSQKSLNFFVHSWIALKQAIFCYSTLINNEELPDNQLYSEDIYDLINLLFQNKIVVSTTLIDSLKALTERIDRGVDVTPKPTFKDEVLEFLTKNMNNLKIS